VRKVAAAQWLRATKLASERPKSQNSLLAGNLPGDGRDQHCVASQAVTQLEIVGPRNPISACQSRLFVNWLSVSPNLSNLGAKSPIVSGLHLKYSRFLETRAGDPVRSALRGVEGSQPQSMTEKAVSDFSRL
jgi:hypothetical protein